MVEPDLDAEEKVHLSPELARRAGLKLSRVEAYARSREQAEDATPAVDASPEPSAAIWVPQRAVVRVGGQPTVFVAAEEASYIARVVELGDSVGEDVSITRGVVSGDWIVTAGLFALKSELFR
jgi:hypothetical protein